MRSLCPRGDPRGRFRGVRGIGRWEDHLLVCESVGVVQVFRGHEFHFAYPVPGRAGGRFEPTSIATLPDARAVLAVAGEESALLLVDRSGRLLRVIAEAGEQEGCVVDPSDVALAEGSEDRTTRVCVIDRDGDRIQVFTLDGHCYGAFREV